MRPLNRHEIALLAANALVAGWMVIAIWPARDTTHEPFLQSVIRHTEALPECHCGSGSSIPPSTRHRYYGFSEVALLPTGFDPRAHRVYEERHAQAYVDWWNVDEGILRAAAIVDDELLRRAATHIRLSAQNTTLGSVHLQTLIGTAEDRRWPSAVFDQLERTAGSSDTLAATLRAALPRNECYLVVGVDLATGEVRLATPDIHGHEGLWGFYPVAVIDLHHTAYAFHVGESPEAFLDLVWPQINRVALEERAEQARALTGGELRVSSETLHPLDDAAWESNNGDWITEADATVIDHAASPESSLDQALTDLMGEEWLAALKRVVETAPDRAVLAVLLESGELAVFHVADPALQGVCGAVPIAVFTPDQAAQLDEVDWDAISARWERWRGAI